MIGFGWALRVVGFVVLFLMIIANLTITSRMTPFKKPVNIFEFFHPFKELPFDLVAVGSFCFFLGMFLPINYVSSFRWSPPCVPYTFLSQKRANGITHIF